MNEYNTPEDFLLDETFVEWIERSNDKSIENWEAWMKLNPAKKEMVDEARLWIENMKAKESITKHQVNAATERFKTSLNKVTTIRQKSYSMYLKMSVAAIFLVALSLSIFYFQSNESPSIKTPYGKIAKQILPDGTEITLNANSEIKYAKEWNEREDREVWIKGEGLFHVKKTLANSRFIVHTKEFDVIVTGTLFNVINRDDVTNVVLKEGHITIKEKNGELIYLKPGEFVEYKNKSYLKKNIEPESAVAWADQKMVFDKTPLSAVVKTIKEYYGVEIYLSDPSLASETISGMLPNDNIDVLIKSLEATGEFKVKKEDSKLFIESTLIK